MLHYSASRTILDRENSSFSLREPLVDWTSSFWLVDIFWNAIHIPMIWERPKYLARPVTSVFLPLQGGARGIFAVHAKATDLWRWRKYLHPWCETARITEQSARAVDCAEFRRPTKASSALSTVNWRRSLFLGAVGKFELWMPNQPVTLLRRHKLISEAYVVFLSAAIVFCTILMYIHAFSSCQR